MENKITHNGKDFKISRKDAMGNPVAHQPDFSKHTGIPTGPEAVKPANKPATNGQINMEAGIQFVVNPQMPLPEGFKFGTVFI